jgi:hypothetical protein
VSPNSTRLGRTPPVEPASLDQLLQAIEKVAVRSRGLRSTRAQTSSTLGRAGMKLDEDSRRRTKELTSTPTRGVMNAAISSANTIDRSLITMNTTTLSRSSSAHYLVCLQDSFGSVFSNGLIFRS